MAGVPLLFSLVFFAVFGGYLFLGIHIIHSNPRAGPNRLFLALCISLCIWSLGFSMANSAASMEICLFWRRFSALGWTSAYSIFLHFFLALSNKTPLRRFTCGLMYSPAVISMYIFAVSPSSARAQYNFVQMANGWVNVATHTGWDIFFYTYYAGYILLCLAVLWHWRRKTEAQNVHKQAQLISRGILIALVLGTFTDIILSSHLKNPLPQMAPLITLIPIITIYYSTRRYGLMREVSEPSEELILSDAARVKLYHYLGLAFIAGGLLNISSVFWYPMFPDNAGLAASQFSGGMFLLSGLVIIISRVIKLANARKFLIILTVASSIPLVTLKSAEYGDASVWPFPMLLMMLSLVFDSRIPLISVTAAAVATQIAAWIYASSRAALTNPFTYILRIGGFVIAYFIGAAVNDIYINRLKENLERSA